MATRRTDTKNNEKDKCIKKKKKKLCLLVSCSGLLPSMMQRQQGNIIFVSSVVGRLPIPYRSAYTASKHAMQAFADCLRAEMAAYNIHVLVSSPGYVATDVSMNALTGYGTAHGGNFQPNVFRVIFFVFCNTLF